MAKWSLHDFGETDLVFLQVNGLPVGLYIKESSEVFEKVHLWQRLFEHASITAESEAETETSLVSEDWRQLIIQDSVVHQGYKVDNISVSLATQLKNG